MTERLLDANIKGTVEPIEESIRLLTKLRDAWSEVKMTATPGAHCHDGSANGRRGRHTVEGYSIHFAEELRLLRVMLDCSRTQQQAAVSRDIELLGRATHARDEAMRAIQESERIIAAWSRCPRA